MTIIKIVKGDITELKIDAIVNAANNTLRGGGGVDGAIHFAAGLELLKECISIGFCDTGDAKLTKGYNLPAKYVIHTVGPIYGHENKNEEDLLKNCYINCLMLAKESRIKSLAFPGISTGVFRFPKELACQIAIGAVNNFIKENPESFDEIIFALFDDVNYEIYKKVIANKNLLTK